MLRSRCVCVRIFVSAVDSVRFALKGRRKVGEPRETRSQTAAAPASQPLARSDDQLTIRHVHVHAQQQQQWSLTVQPHDADS